MKLRDHPSDYTSCTPPIRHLLATLLMSLGMALPGSAQSSFVNFEVKQTAPIRVSPSGNRLFAVNTPDGRLSVYDITSPSNPILIAEIPVGIGPVSVNARSEDEAWVVNEVSDSISIVSVSSHLVTDNLHVKDEPADVVFARGRAFVSAARRNQVRVFDITNHTAVATIPLMGENPRALAVSADGSRVFVAFALSGNRTTLVPPDQAPPQSPPTNPALPPPPQVGLIVDASDSIWNPSVIKYNMPDNDVAEIDTASLGVTRYYPRVGTVNLALAVQPGSGNLYVANTEARNLVHFEPNLRGHIVENRLARINIGSGSVTNFDLNPGVDYNLLPNPAAKTNALAQPSAIVFGPSGSFLFLASFGTDRIAKLDANGNILARIEIGSTPGSLVDPRHKRGPRGLALGPAGSQRLYVLNRIANTISVVDIANNLVLREFPVGSHDPTPAAIRDGRGFLYDAKLSGNGTASCASCHVDAEMDLIAWDLGDPGGSMSVVNSRPATNLPPINFQMHPMKGPMSTQTLRGIDTLDPLHWRGDRTNFLHFNGAFDSLLGGATLPAADMVAYRNFINTIRFQANPNQNLDRTLPTSFANGNPVAGRNTFLNEIYQPGLTCNTCHTVPEGSNRLLIPASALQESQDFKVPQLRNVYQKLNLTHAPGADSVGGFGIIHDGMDPDLFTFLSRSVFGLFANDTTRKRNLEAFVQCFDTGTAPAVGYARTAVGSNVNAASLLDDWTLLEGQATANNIDLIAKGTIDGKLHGLLYRPATDDYRTDQSGFGPFTRVQLQMKISAGDTLTLMGTPPGSGERMGIDRDADGTLDSDIAAPALEVARADDQTVISWSTNAANFVLESSPVLSGAGWSPASGERVTVGTQFLLTNSVPIGNLFFRLREL